MTLALTGGTGFVGQAVLDLLEGRRERVRVLARKVPQDKRGFRWVEGSLNEPFALAHLVADAECVIHIAGLTRAVNPDHFEIVNVTGTLNVVEAAVRAGEQDKGGGAAAAALHLIALSRKWRNAPSGPTTSIRPERPISRRSARPPSGSR